MDFNSRKNETPITWIYLPFGINSRTGIWRQCAILIVTWMERALRVMVATMTPWCHLDEWLSGVGGEDAFLIINQQFKKLKVFLLPGLPFRIVFDESDRQNQGDFSVLTSIDLPLSLPATMFFILVESLKELLSPYPNFFFGQTLCVIVWVRFGFELESD